MAPVWVTLLLSLSSLLQVPAYKLPALQRGGQDDRVRGLAAGGGSQPASRGQSAWDAVGTRAADLPVFLRGKRQAEEKLSNHSAEDSTPGHPNTFAVAFSEPTGKGSDSSPTSELVDETDSTDPLEDYFSETTEPWSVAASNNITAGTLVISVEKTAPMQSTSNVSSKVAVNGTEDIPTGSTESWENSFISSANVTALGETSPTSPPETLRESSGISTEPSMKGSATSRPGLLTVGKTNSSCLTSGAGSSVTANAHLQILSDHTNILVGKCLLAVFILALVAGIFIICTAVLATLLWRQKRDCQAHQSNATEMVCISALLPDSEPVANGGKPGKVKRMKMPMDNGSETDVDNLTLSSFLPDH